MTVLAAEVMVDGKIIGIRHLASVINSKSTQKITVENDTQKRGEMCKCKQSRDRCKRETTDIKEEKMVK